MLSHGEIIERGTHEELLAHEGYYYNLYSMQFRSQELGLTQNPLAEPVDGDGRLPPAESSVAPMPARTLPAAPPAPGRAAPGGP